jgi:hypothetical protein
VDRLVEAVEVVCFVGLVVVAGDRFAVEGEADPREEEGTAPLEAVETVVVIGVVVAVVAIHFMAVCAGIGYPNLRSAKSVQLASRFLFFIFGTLSFDNTNI